MSRAERISGNEDVVVEAEDGISVITLNRPEARNGISKEMWESLHDHLVGIRLDDAVRVVVITGTDGSFSAGDDIKQVASLMERAWSGEGSITDVREITLLIQQVTLDIVRMPKPVIAAINGWALGAGLELALACDFSYAAESAKLGFPETSIGVVLTGGSTHLLSRMIPLPQAKELAFTYRKITAHQAEKLGLVNRVVPDAELMDAVRGVAREIIQNSPVAVGLQKLALQFGSESTLSQALDYETEQSMYALASEDGKAGLRSFLGDRPVWPGR